MSSPLTRDDLRLFPEPSAVSFFSGHYVFDQKATTTYYADLFAGRSATEVAQFIEALGQIVLYTSPDKIAFPVDRRLLVVQYRVWMTLTFSEGIFSDVEIFSAGVK